MFFRSFERALPGTPDLIPGADCAVICIFLIILCFKDLIK